MNATVIESTKAMPRTGAYLTRIHTFIGYQSPQDVDQVCEDHDLAWWLIANFVAGNVDEEGLSVRGWDLVEDLDNQLHDMYDHWASFQTANGE